MKRWLCVIAIITAVLAVVLGSARFDFDKVKASMEDVEASASILETDVNTITLFSYVMTDFFKGADNFSLNLSTAVDENDTPVFYVVTYMSYIDGERLSMEEFYWGSEDSPTDWTEREMALTFTQMQVPIYPFTMWSGVEYDGIFAGILEAVQYITYILGLVWAVVSIVLLISIDTLGVAWAVIKVAFMLVGIGV